MTSYLKAVSDYPYVEFDQSFSDNDTSISVKSGHGDRLPNTATEGQFYLTIHDRAYASCAAAFYAGKAETMLVTGRTGDDLIVQRDILGKGKIAITPNFIGFRGVTSLDWADIDNYLKYLHMGAGSPEGVLTATVGHVYLRTSGSPDSVLYVKESGSGNTGWRSLAGSYLLNAKANGIKGDGVTDDSTAINSFISARSAGDTVYFPPGEYYIGTTTITWKSGVSAIFDNAKFTIDTHTSYPFAFDISGCSDFSFNGHLAIHGNNGGSTNRAKGIGATSSDVNRFWIESLHVEDLACGIRIRANDASIGRITGRSIIGYDGAATIGPLLYLEGALRVTVGEVSGYDIAREAVYFAPDGSNNECERCSVGQINIYNNSAWAGTALRIRGALHCQVGTVRASNLDGYGVHIGQESGDTAVDCDDIQIGIVQIEDCEDGFCVFSYEATQTIRNLQVGSIATENCGLLAETHYAVRLEDIGSGSIGNIFCRTNIGNTHGCVVEDSSNLHIESISIADWDYYPVTFNHVTFCSAGLILLKSCTGNYTAVRILGTVTNTSDFLISAIIGYALGSHGISFSDSDRCHVGQVLLINIGATSGDDTADAFVSQSTSSGITVGNIVVHSTGAIKHRYTVNINARTAKVMGSVYSNNGARLNHIAYNSDTFKGLEGGDLFESGAPSGGTWNPGEKVWNTAPTAGAGTGMGWVYIGSPTNAWKAFGDIAS